MAVTTVRGWAGAAAGALVLVGALVLPGCGDERVGSAAPLDCRAELVATRLHGLAEDHPAQDALVDEVADGCEQAGRVLAEAFRLQLAAAAELSCDQPPPPPSAGGMAAR